MENREIRQHPEGIPVLGDVFLFQSLVDLKTKRVKVDQFLPSASTDNFEWTSQKATAGDYDEDDLVTYEGNFYQSAVNNNPSVPGQNSDWVLRATSYSGFTLWQAGVFSGDEIFTMYKFDFADSVPANTSTVFIFRLASATRPFNSTNFLTELAAGDWELLGKATTVVVSTELVSDIITIDFLSLQRFNFIQSAEIVDDKAISFDNPVEGSEGCFIFSMDVPHTLTFPVGTKMVSPSNAEWTSPDWAPLEGGEYEMTIRYINSEFKVSIAGPYT